MQEHPSTNSPQAFEPQCKTEIIEANCEQHGAYECTVREIESLFPGNPIQTRSRCPECEKVRIRESQERDRIQREYAASVKVKNSLVPKRFINATFDNYVAASPEQKAALNICRAYVDGWEANRTDGTSLVLTGRPGTGKTHLACAIALAVIREHLVQPEFGTVSAMLRTIKSTYRPGSDRTEQEAIQGFASVDLLILDEVGVQIGSEHEKLLMFEVLNERYQEMKPTILISNLSGDELEGFLGHRVMDRYRECGAVIPFDWESHRGQS